MASNQGILRRKQAGIKALPHVEAIGYRNRFWQFKLGRHESDEAHDSRCRDYCLEES